MKPARQTPIRLSAGSGDEERCRACGSGFPNGMDRVWMNDGGAYHRQCADGAYEYERGKLHGRNDLELSQRHCRDLQRQVDAVRVENSRLKMQLARLRSQKNRSDET